MIKINLLRDDQKPKPKFDDKILYWLDEKPRYDWELAGYGVMLGFWAGIGIAVWMI